LSTTSTTLNELVWHIYAIGIPKEEDFLTIMMLNAMVDDLPHVRNHIADALATSTSANPYSPSNICSRLDVEQQLINTEKSKGGDVVLAATGKGAGTHHEWLPCGTCGNSSHPTKDCFRKGGVMEGKCEEVMTRHRVAREARNAKSSKPSTSTSKPTASMGKPRGLRYDTSGCAYLLDSETNHAIYIASSESWATTPSESSTEFAGLASDSITPQAILLILSIILSSEKQYGFVSLSLRASLPMVMLNAFP
jgi:hypothetical protein